MKSSNWSALILLLQILEFEQNDRPVKRNWKTNFMESINICLYRDRSASLFNKTFHHRNRKQFSLWTSNQNFYRSIETFIPEIKLFLTI